MWGVNFTFRFSMKPLLTKWKTYRRIQMKNHSEEKSLPPTKNFTVRIVVKQIESNSWSKFPPSGKLIVVTLLYVPSRLDSTNSKSIHEPRPCPWLQWPPLKFWNPWQHTSNRLCGLSLHHQLKIFSLIYLLNNGLL